MGPVAQGAGGPDSQTALNSSVGPTWGLSGLVSAEGAPDLPGSGVASAPGTDHEAGAGSQPLSLAVGRDVKIYSFTQRHRLGSLGFVIADRAAVNHLA